jgi:hypothetical protein
MIMERSQQFFPPPVSSSEQLTGWGEGGTKHSRVNLILVRACHLYNVTTTLHEAETELLF